MAKNKKAAGRDADSPSRSAFIRATGTVNAREVRLDTQSADKICTVLFSLLKHETFRYPSTYFYLQYYVKYLVI